MRKAAAASHWHCRLRCQLHAINCVDEAVKLSTAGADPEKKSWEGRGLHQ